MNFLYETFSLFFNQVMPQSAVILSLIVLVGYLLLKYPLREAFAGSLKGVLGIIIMQYGSEAMIRIFSPLLLSLESIYHLNIFVGDPYLGYPAVLEALGDKIALGSYVLILGFFWNVLLVKLRSWTKIRSLFLTGHIMYLQSTFVLWLVYNHTSFSTLSTVIISGILCGTYWAVGSNLILDATNKVTDGADFTIGHQQMIGSWIATKIAPLIGDPEKSIEDFKAPSYAKKLNNNIAAPSIMMLIFFGIISFILGSESFNTLIGGSNMFFNVITLGLSFTISLILILTGVRMFVGELSISFRGISEKFLPGAVVAVDCAALYGFSPYAMFFGFIMGAFGQAITLGVLFVLGAPSLIIPGFIPVFFDNATIGIFANKFGGYKALIIICFFSGVIQIAGGSWAASMSGLKHGWMGNFDWIAVWPVAISILENFKFIGFILLIVTGLIVSITQHKKKQAKLEFTV